jgi:hypothetical protein
MPAALVSWQWPLYKAQRVEVFCFFFSSCRRLRHDIVPKARLRHDIVPTARLRHDKKALTSLA